MVESFYTLGESPSTAAFLDNPVGHFIRRPSFTYWYPRAGFTGFALFGQPTVSDIRELNAIMGVVLAPRKESHISLIDTSFLECAWRGNRRDADRLHGGAKI